MHYYKFNIGDYRKNTMHLSPIEHYIYRELIDIYYLDESPIPAKTHLVLRLLRLSEEYEKSLNLVLNEFFTLNDDKWQHNRIDSDIQRYHKSAEKNRINGKKGGRPRKKVETEWDTDGNPNESQSKGNHKPINNKKKKIIKKEKSTRFIPPDISDVTEYCDERNNGIDPQQFIDHYEANGWMRGKTRVKDWKACVRTWERSRKEKQANNNQEVAWI